jgi:hypothetical protein
LRARDGVFVDAKSIRARAALDSDRLLVGQLIELAGDFGYEAQYVHADWNWLRQTVASRPVLLILKNANVVAVLNSGLSDAEEVVLIDPLYNAGESLVLPRKYLEPAWLGDALIITPRREESVVLVGPSGFENSDQSSPAGKPSRGLTVPFAVILLCLIPATSVWEPAAFPNKQSGQIADILASNRVTVDRGAAPTREVEEQWRPDGAMAQGLTTNPNQQPASEQVPISSAESISPGGIVLPFAAHRVREEPTNIALSATPPIGPSPSTDQTTSTMGDNVSSVNTATSAPVGVAVGEAIRRRVPATVVSATAVEPPPAEIAASGTVVLRGNGSERSGAVGSEAPGFLDKRTGGATSDNLASTTADVAPNPSPAEDAAQRWRTDVATTQRLTPSPDVQRTASEQVPISSPHSATPGETISTPDAHHTGEEPTNMVLSAAVPAEPSPAASQPASTIGGAASPAEAVNSAQVGAAAGETIWRSVPATAVTALLARGDGYLQSGDITSARLCYEYVAGAGDANGALRLAETFDPVFLERAHLAGSGANMQQALVWYRRARYLGSSEAGILLGQLEAKQ